MRMNAETMKRNGVVLSVQKSLGDRATVEAIVLVSGYSEQQVRQALKSLEKQGLKR